MARNFGQGTAYAELFEEKIIQTDKMSALMQHCSIFIYYTPCLHGCLHHESFCVVLAWQQGFLEVVEELLTGHNRKQVRHRSG